MIMKWIWQVSFDSYTQADLMNSMELSKFDSDHYISDYMYGKEDYLYTEFCEYLPDWVKADRIIRKQLKDRTDKPLVPKSSFDPLHHLQSKESEAVKKESREEAVVKPTQVKKLIQVIDEEGTPGTPETPERLDGEAQYPSLILQPKPVQKNETPSDLPLITKQQENVIDTMKEHIAATVSLNASYHL